VLDDHLKSSEAEKDLWLECQLVQANPQANRRLKFYGIDSNRVEFTSRFMPADALAIYRTLVILDRLAERSFTRFIYLTVNGETDQRAAVQKLAVALHFLTYADIGNVKKDSVEQQMTELRTNLEKDLSAFLHDSKGFMAKLDHDFDPYHKKRLWCSIRDYLKSPEFNEHFVNALELIDHKEATHWRRKNVEKAALAQMELPGDVWNNDPIFREGLFSPHLGPMPKSWDMPRTIREIHSHRQMVDQNVTFYPEQLDVTFDFVPRMCDKLQCHHCIFGGGISKLCHPQRDFYCPVTLAACGYFFMCDPDNCAFKSDSVRDVCKSSIAKYARCEREALKSI
jgi:hypothetical protein